MNAKRLLKQDKNNKIGEGREYLVSQFIRKRYKWSVKPSSFFDDVHNEIDLICRKPDQTLVYVQVKGFHSDWRNEQFPKLSSKAIEDDAIPYVMYVNKAGKIYVRTII